MNGNEARKIFINYFKKHGHTIVRSAPLVPDNDPTLLFVNAGMVQFKRVFIGEDKRDYTKAVTSQKCVRAGGKHNDLENVGYTARHHTFFEMLGNFSFGDYFKDQAIEFAWDLLLNGYELPREKLWISIYNDDDEAFEIWNKKIGIEKERIIRFGDEENFWSMGDTGPCGPCSEIHYDRGESYGCGKADCALGCDCDRYLEIWNLVFMQFNRDENGVMTPLPKPSIDTGMGLERILSIKQNAETNYETDLFIPIMQKVEELSGKKIKESKETEIAMKVISDHSRAATFLINDGILPSNEGRGYVLRRIIRRAIRYGRFIGLTKPFLKDTISVVIGLMKDAFPEVSKGGAFIMKVVENEEIRFSETLDKGLSMLEESISELKKKGETVIPGKVAFNLYDTFGFPLDIVRDIIRGSEITVDEESYEKEMEKQKQQSKKKVTFQGVGNAFKSLTEKGVRTEFLGYHDITGSSEILLMVAGEKSVTTAQKGLDVDIVTQRTPFYAESGGQAGDRGKIKGDNFEADVVDVLKDPTGLFIHKCRILSGSASVKDLVTLHVDREKRERTALNHTATHILHTVLREVLGDHVKQAGSLVSHDRLRFDFTHFSNIEYDDLKQVEARVNYYIRQNVNVSVQEMDADEALKSGATALFEEKYGDVVRVVSLSDFSRELCGGIHTERTGNIGFFKLVSENGIASGVRRIEALTGNDAVLFTQKDAHTLSSVSNLVKSNQEEVVLRVEKLIRDNRKFEKEIEGLRSQIAASSLVDIDKDVKEIQGIKVLAKKVEVEKPSELRDLADKFKDKIKSGVVILGTAVDNKALLIVIVTKDLTSKYKAGQIVKEIAALVGGGGGGRPDMAQAGGTKPEKLDEALEKSFSIIEKM